LATSNGIAVEAASQYMDPPSMLTGPEFSAAIPRVPPLPASVIQGAKFDDGSQSLDGLNCSQCSFKDTELIYAGGSFRLQDIKVSGTTRLTLTGAAANTLALLSFLRGIEVGISVPPSKPQKPARIASIAKKPMTKLDFSPPFIGQR